jgi:hypothetical protein
MAVTHTDRDHSLDDDAPVRCDSLRAAFGKALVALFEMLPDDAMRRQAVGELIEAESRVREWLARKRMN